MGDASLAVVLPDLSAFAQPGVYILYRAGTVVYVGQAVDMRRRISNHIGEGTKHFDSVAFVACSVAFLSRTEQHYIEKFSPEYNKCGFSITAKARIAAGLAPTSPLPEKLLTAVEAAQYLGMEIEDFREFKRSPHGPRGRRMPRSKATRYHPAELRACAPAAGT